MHISELDFSYPDELVATQPSRNFRTMVVRGVEYVEQDSAKIDDLFTAGDVLVLNETKVLKRRIFTSDGLEVLFLKQTSTLHWEVLFPARGFKVGDDIAIPGDKSMKLVAKGLPQTVEVSEELSESYFNDFGELALPPYIQKQRGERHNVKSDDVWYQTQWANKPGSYAAPTASLHFTDEDIEALVNKGVVVEKVTLHVGLGTFLPVKAVNLNDHKMHSEWCEVSAKTIENIQQAKRHGKKVFALGTTVARTLESWKSNMLNEQPDGGAAGETDIFITPGYEFKVVDVLMTNFHQPKSTLLAMVAAFADLQTVKSAYKWAIDNKFKLFSYGDFSIWFKE